MPITFLTNEDKTIIDQNIAQLSEEKVNKVTPQMYGAVADGVTDDTAAFASALANNKRLFVPAGDYCVTDLSPGNCEIIGERGARLIVSGVISYDGVYYPRMSNVALVSAGENREYMMLIKESYYGLFEGVQFSNKDNKAVEIGVLLDGSGDGNGVYYQCFEHCVFDYLPIGIKFYSIANVHTIAKSVFYKCGTCVYNDSAESILITENCFQDFAVSGVKIDKTAAKGLPVSSLIQGNYFEADVDCVETTFVGDVDFSANDACRGNFVQANHYSWRKAAHHVVNMVAENMVQDFYTRQESSRPNQLMGITALHVVPHTFPAAYGGDHFHGSLMPVEAEDGSISLYFYGKTSNGQNAWHRVLTTGYNENSTVTMPPIYANKIGQGYRGFVQIGYDADEVEEGTTIFDRWLTYDTNHKLLMLYNEAAGKWVYYQNVAAGTTAERPTWKPQGYVYYDTDLGKPIFSTGANTWVDAIGGDADGDTKTVRLPPVFANTIAQAYGGYIQLGYDADSKENPGDKWMTYDTGHKLLMIYNKDAEKWEHYQKVTSGTTAERPTWKPAGYVYYDTELKKPIFATGSNKWVDADGNDPDASDAAAVFELIDTITLETDGEGMTVETEPDGTAYSFKKMSVQIITPAGTKNEAATIYFYLSDGKVMNSYAENIVGTAETTSWHHLTIDEDKLVECQYIPQKTSASGHYMLVSDSSQKSFRYISEYHVKVTKFLAGSTLPAGTVIKIYGVRG